MIYCVEDDAAIRELIVYALLGAGFDARGFCDGSSFFDAVREQSPALVILDIMLPEQDGLSILRRLRDNPATKNIPIMMATAKGSEYDKVVGLDSGADDYLAKPFGMMEMVSRVKALLRRSGQGKLEPALTVGEITMLADKHKVFVKENEIPLTLKEYELLHLLMKSPERVFTRDTVLSEVWGYSFDGETRTVDVHMRTLRQKLGVAGGQLETVRGVGYRINLKSKEDAE